MKLIECLNQLPDDMMMIDLSEIIQEKKHRTVAQLREGLADRHAQEEGYEVRQRHVHYGKIAKYSIGKIGDFNLYNQL